jgi:hypothetical protein
MIQTINNKSEGQNQLHYQKSDLINLCILPKHDFNTMQIKILLSLVSSDTQTQ